MGLIHLCLDIETLGYRENAVVATLSCVPFVFEENSSYSDLFLSGFYVKFDVKEQISRYKRAVDPDTVRWWSEQPKEARETSILPHKDDVSMAEGLSKLREFIEKSGYSFNKSYVWSRGNYFDFPKIEHMYWQLEEKPPFNTYKARDTRTYIDILTGSDRGQYELKGGTPEQFVKHHALHDAALDTKRLLEIYHDNLS